jgi:N6-L-threonylcarbamoyladenine synthase
VNVLGIETSCDETCASVVRDTHHVLSNVVASSLAQHAAYGGVIPEIASRAHLESICFVVDEALKNAKIRSKDLDAIAVTQGPGLVGSLLVGISFARALSLGWDLPLLGINHVRAHLYAAFIEHKISFPFVGLVVSGGHTSLYRVKSLSEEELIGSTRDDAAGEAFDKVAKILGLGYPGGPVIEKLAQSGRKNAFSFRCDCGGGLDFSFSGIKTSVLYKVRELEKMYGNLSAETIADLCASFQEAVISDLVDKSMRAVKRAHARDLVVGGGVAFNVALRERLQGAALSQKINFFIAPKDYCLDNAAMVASLGCRFFGKKGRKRQLRLDPLVG